MRVAIVGAGICGLYLAQKLSQKNKIFLFEKEEGVGGKICSALLSERIFDFFPESEKLVKNKIKGCRIHFPKKEVNLKFKKSFFAFKRKELDQLAFQLAERDGVKFFFNKEIRSIDIVSLQEEFERVIGCDGAGSVVRKFLKIREPAFYLGCQGFLWERDFSNYVEIWPKEKIDGFIWKIPKGKEIEFGAMGVGRVGEELRTFLDEKKIQLEKIEFAPISQGFSIPKNSKVTLCGEAVGLTKPWSGGGIVWGLTMADILIKSFPDFERYRRGVKKFFSIEFYLSKILKKLVYFFGFNFPFILPREKELDGDFWFKSAKSNLH